MKNYRSQSSIEFIILIGFVMFGFLLFFLFINEMGGLKNKEHRNLELKNLAMSIKDEISLASKSSDGYFRQFYIPNNLQGKEISVNITGEMVYINTIDQKEGIAYPVQAVNGQPILGNNTIRKQGGEIYLNQ
ncbi:MAG: hypothetical protein Q8N99_01620 [Nanoarchaeota archaeon]|nr:hypothetical protein [Nanoarchaeota archaeon]